MTDIANRPKARLTTLGQLSLTLVASDGTPRVLLKPGKPLALVTYLALSPRHSARPSPQPAFARTPHKPVVGRLGFRTRASHSPANCLADATNARRPRNRRPRARSRSSHAYVVRSKRFSERGRAKRCRGGGRNVQRTVPTRFRRSRKSQVCSDWSLQLLGQRVSDTGGNANLGGSTNKFRRPRAPR